MVSVGSNIHAGPNPWDRRTSGSFNEPPWRTSWEGPLVNSSTIPSRA